MNVWFLVKNQWFFIKPETCITFLVFKRRNNSQIGLNLLFDTFSLSTLRHFVTGLLDRKLKGISMFVLYVLYWSTCSYFLVNDPELSLFGITYSKKYPFTVFSFDLKVICIFLFSVLLIYLQYLEEGILAIRIIAIFISDYLWSEEDCFMNCNWSDLFCTNFNSIYSIMLIALVCEYMYHILICYKDWNSVSKA